MIGTLLCLVVAVTDGDTIKARCDIDGQKQEIKVRLSEIDAPEKAQPFGQKSKQSLSSLCFQKSSEIKPVTTDRYGRTVARVTCAGIDANMEQVKRGMAWAYTRYLKDPSIKSAEIDARAASAGLWTDKDPMPPWAWRRK